MSDEKTIIMPEGSSVDPNLMLAMNGGGMGGFNSPLWAIILLAFLRNNFGWNGDGNNTAFVSSQLGQAIAGNANAISNLATSLNCTEGQIQAAIANVQQAINMNQNAMTTGFGNLAYENAANTCAIKQNATDNTGRILAKLDAIEDSRKDREIGSLTAALTAANSRAERQAELAPIYKQLSDIACKQPQTFQVPYQPFTAIPNCVAYQMGINGFGLNPNGTIWS